MVRHSKPPSQTWRTFLDNHVRQLASIDFFTVHTIWFEILFVFIVLVHDRRRVVHFNVTTHPTTEWTARKCSKPFHSTACRNTCCEIAMQSTGMSFEGNST